MRKIVFKTWPYPSSIKAMILRVGNPVCNGKGNWHTDVIFKSFDRKDEILRQDWGLLPMLKTGQIFSDGSKIGHNRNLKMGKFTFDNAGFTFYIDRIKTADGEVARPAFQTKIVGTYYNISLIEVVRSFFARTRRLAYALLELNSIMPLCQCEIDENTKSVVVHFSPDCPSEITRERWLPMMAWMASDELAQKSWDSFHRYFRSCQGPNVIPESMNDIPIFPIKGSFSLDCLYRSYGNTVWLEEIKNIECNSLDFEEITITRYVLGNVGSHKPRVAYIREPKKIEISNSAGGALQSHVTVDVDLSGFVFKKMPRISVIKEILGTGASYVNLVETTGESTAVTGKNEGFSNALLGLEFSANDQDSMEIEREDTETFTIPGLREADPVDLQYNHNITRFLEAMRMLSRKSEIAGIRTKIYQLPGEDSFAWIAPGIRRCCVISVIKLTFGKEIYIIEVDRTIFNSERRWHVATLLNKIQGGNPTEVLATLVHIISEGGHWTHARLSDIGYITYERLRHGNDHNRQRWLERMWGVIATL